MSRALHHDQRLGRGEKKKSANEHFGGSLKRKEERNVTSPKDKLKDEDSSAQVEFGGSTKKPEWRLEVPEWRRRKQNE